MSDSEDNSKRQKAAADVKHATLTKKYAGVKSCVTITFKNLDELKNEGKLTRDLFQRQQKVIEKYVSDIEDLDGQIIDIFGELNTGEDDANRVAEITKQVDFQSDVCMKLSSLATCFPDKEDDNTPADDKSDLLGDVKVKLPPLKCVSFSGKTVDKLEFKNFLLQFHNCIDAAGKLSKSAKLTYLRSYLTDYAFKVISHLSITDSN